MTAARNSTTANSGPNVMKRSCRAGDCLRHQWRQGRREAGLTVAGAEEGTCLNIREVCSLSEIPAPSRPRPIFRHSFQGASGSEAQMVVGLYRIMKSLSAI